jgi:hypothetical protein
MGGAEEAARDQTYRAIGRFMFEFSQAEYSVRHYLGVELGIKDEYLTAVVESYDVGMLTNVAKEVFKKSRKIVGLLNRFWQLNEVRMRVAHGLWAPSMKGGTVQHFSRNKLNVALFADQAKELEKRADELSKLRADLENAVALLPE